MNVFMKTIKDIGTFIQENLVIWLDKSNLAQENSEF